MILQCNYGNKEVYQEADSISVQVVDISEIKDKTKEAILKLLCEQTNYNDCTFIDYDEIFQEGALKNMDIIKIAVLSDGIEQSNNKFLLFSSNTTVYLLNNNGKTIRRL